MAEKEEIKVMKEMIYAVPLKYAWLGPHTDRTRKAVDFLKKFIIRHMKVRKVKISEELNEVMWSRGMKNPPRRIRVRAAKISDETAWVTLPDKKFWFELEKEKKKEEHKEEKEPEVKEEAEGYEPKKEERKVEEKETRKEKKETEKRVSKPGSKKEKPVDKEKQTATKKSKTTDKNQADKN